MTGPKHAAVTVPTRSWVSDDDAGERFRVATRRLLWARLLRDLPDEWSGYGRIETTALDSGTTVVTAYWAPNEAVTL